MPEEIKVSGGTPFVPVGTGVDCDDPDPVIPVPDPEAEPAADITEVVDAPAPDAVVRRAADAGWDDDTWFEPLGAGAAATTTGPP